MKKRRNKIGRFLAGTVLLALVSAGMTGCAQGESGNGGEAASIGGSNEEATSIGGSDEEAVSIGGSDEEAAGIGGGSGEVASVIGGADGPTSIFVAGKTGDEEGTPAAQLDITQAKGEDFGGAAVLDYVSADKISFHCPLGYMVFQADESGKLAPVLGVTFEEAGGLVMEGDGRTAVLGGDTGAMVIPGAYQESGAETLYVFEEESGQIFESPMTEDMMEMIKEVEAQKPSVSEEVRGQLEEAVDEQTGSRILDGPVAVPEFDANVYGFLAADGERLEDIWYGLWWADPAFDNKIEKTVLFEAD